MKPDCTFLFLQKSSGDFPNVLYEVITKRSSVIEGSLTVDDVNNVLDELSANMGKSYVCSCRPLLSALTWVF